MILYKKEKQLVGVFYGGQGFGNEYRDLTEWYDEDDPAYEKEVETDISGAEVIM